MVVEGNRVLPADRTLTVAAGTTLNMGPQAVLFIDRGATLQVQGTSSDPVRIQRLNPDQDWGRIRAHTDGSRVIIHHADISGGKLSLGPQSRGELEDVYLHDVQSPLIIATDHAELLRLKRCHLADYYDVNFNFTRVQAEDCLFENVQSDAFELIGAPAGCYIRRCTFRHCRGNGCDAIDINGGNGVEIADCLFYDIQDKAVSMGPSVIPDEGIQESRDIVVKNSLIYGAGTAIAVKDSSSLRLMHSTVTDSFLGMRIDGAEAETAAQVGGSCNVIWGNETGLQLQEFAEFSSPYSIVQGLEDPEMHTRTMDPEFLDSGSGDYRLGVDLPAEMENECAPAGPVFPVGAAMSASHPGIVDISVMESGALNIQFYVDTEKQYILQMKGFTERSWSEATQVAPQRLPYLASVFYSPDTGRDSGSVELFRLLSMPAK
jgi:hypothetical protein